jgi:hypothetical protein
VSEKRKQAVSIRMNSSDLSKVKRLAQRLGVRDSDVIRFAVKGMLARLGPLHDPDVAGRGLVPVFVESGGELLRFFELDAARLETIINAGISEPGRRVDRDDIALLALTVVPEPYAQLRLSELSQQAADSGEPVEMLRSLRQYLYDKYVYHVSAPGNGVEGARLTAVIGGRHD